MIDFLKGTVTPKDWAAVAGILGLIAALSSAYFFTLHKNTLIEIDEISTINVQVMANLERAREISAKIDETERETKTIENLVQSFESKLPSRSEIRELFKTVEEMAAEENVAIEIKPLLKNQDATKMTIPYQIVTKGNFHNIASFINRLERYERYLKVSDLKMEPYKDGISTFRFKMNTYRFLKTLDTGDAS